MKDLEVIYQAIKKNFLQATEEEPRYLYLYMFEKKFTLYLKEQGDEDLQQFEDLDIIQYKKVSTVGFKNKIKKYIHRITSKGEVLNLTICKNLGFIEVEVIKPIKIENIEPGIHPISENLAVLMY